MLAFPLVLVLAVVPLSASVSVSLGKGAHSNLVELATELNLTKFVEALDETKISHVINHEGRFTVFAPTDAAFAREKVYPQEATLRDKILLHIGQGEVVESAFANEQVISTVQSKRTVRINVYPNGVTTANGRVVASTDHFARNGVIHVLDDVMSSVYKRAGSVVSELDECCPEHSTMLGLIRESGLWDMLDETGPYTFLSPDNDAFAKLHPDFILHLKKNATALRNFMLGHVVPQTHYSAGLQEGQRLKTALGNKIPVHFEENGTLHLGKASVTLSDVTAVNGVVHVIDDVLFPRHEVDNDTVSAKSRRPHVKPVKKNLNRKAESNASVFDLLKYLGF